MHPPRFLSAALAAWPAAVLVAAAPGPAMAQWSAVYQQATLPAPHNEAFRRRAAAADRLLNGIEASSARIFGTLWAARDVSASATDRTLSAFLAREPIARPPRFRTAVAGAPSETFRKLVPEVQATADWAYAFLRQVYDVLADDQLFWPDRDGRITELLGFYASRSDLALSTRPRSVGMLDADPDALGFRRGFPSSNGLLWHGQWLEAALLEALVRGQSAAEQRQLVEQVLTRFHALAKDPPSTTPYLTPMAPAVAPEFSRRYPAAAAILDNLHMLQGRVADLLVAPEVPRSAKRREIRRAAGSFRGDSTPTMDYRTWVNAAEILGVENMGGPAVGFGPEPPRPTVARGASLATPADRARMMAMQDIGHGAAMSVSDDTGLRAVLDRMLSDPVIRERVGTDPKLQGLLANSAGRMDMSAMPGMPDGAMPGMQPGAMPARSGQTAPDMAMPGMLPDGGSPSRAVSAEERRQALGFLARLLSDPAVAARIHASPELHRLWSDPEVQQRIEALRRGRPGSVAPSPAKPSAPHDAHPPAREQHGSTP